MITGTVPLWQTQSWQEQLADIIRSPAELLELLDLDPQWLPAAEAAARQFPLRVPRSFAARMRPGDPRDPLLLQVLPLGEELQPVPGYGEDPLEERSANPAPGLIHKYHNRVLLIAASACGVHCRYCFRRHFPYGDNNPSREQWREALDYIAAHPEVDEVIFSGGDPLAANDRYLAWLVEAVAAIPHVARLRIHSRLPVVIPDRLDDACLDWLTGTRLRPVLVIHANHARELDGQVAAAMQRARRRGVLLLNQTVLLAGINDEVDTLEALSLRLFDIGVQPYYLHTLDKVAGSAHFHVSDARAQALCAELAAGQSGYLVPKLVKETPSAPAKVPLDIAQHWPGRAGDPRAA